MLGRSLRRLLPSYSRDAHVQSMLSRIEETVQRQDPLEGVLALLDHTRQPMFDCLYPHFHSTAAAQAVTLKILNLCLAKYHFLAHSTSLLSRPFGLNVDPSDACNLACPGCVHSQHVKEMKLFQWDKNILSESRLAALLECYGPYAIHVVFCNYGEPLINPETPKLIRLARRYLVQAMTSTNLSIGRFDADAYVESGLDYMIVSVDGATQETYQKFRRNGDIELVFNNIRKLVEAKRRLGKRTPVIAWRYLTFQHNVHEVGLATEKARELGVDQFLTLPPYDVSWDDPTIQPASIEPVNILFNPQTETCVIENWNPFPDNLAAEAIDREFRQRWTDKLAGLPANGAGHPPASGTTCHYLYKTITMDGGGRMFPCCAPPRPEMELVFARFEGHGASDIYNSDHYQQARLSFADPEAYQRGRSSRPLAREPHCANCEWDKEAVTTGPSQIKLYLKAAGSGLFNPVSEQILSGW